MEEIDELRLVSQRCRIFQEVLQEERFHAVEIDTNTTNVRESKDEGVRSFCQVCLVLFCILVLVMVCCKGGKDQE